MKKPLIALTLTLFGIGSVSLINIENINISTNKYSQSSTSTEVTDTDNTDDIVPVNKEDDTNKSAVSKKNSPNYKTIYNNLTGEVTEKSPIIYYTYTAPINGKYHFELSERTADNNVYIAIYDKNGKELTSKTNECTITLSKNEVYKIHIKRYTKDSKYVVKIGVPNNIIDLTGTASITGEISYKNQLNEYTYVAQTTGRYRFELLDRTEDNNIYLRIKNKNEKILKDTTNNITVDLTAGEKYTIQVEYYSKLSKYKLAIGCPDKITDISGKTYIAGEIRYKDQINVYTYTPTITGRYRIELAERTADNNIYLRIKDKNEKILKDTPNHTTVDLVAGEKYTIEAQYVANLSKYVLTLGVPNDIINITGIVNLNGEIKFKDQINRYVYTPIYSGTYYFDLINRTEDASVGIEIRDKNERVLKNTTNKCKVALAAGEQYSVDISHYTKNCTYLLSVTPE